MSRLFTRLAFVFGAVFAVAACSPAPQGTPGALSIIEPWTMATPPGAAVGVGYMTIRNQTGAAVRLTGGESPVAQRVEVHSMSMDGGVMTMRPVEGGLEIPVGGTVELKPGGLHLMLIGLKSPLTEGGSIPLTLVFDNGMRIDAPLSVRAIGAGMTIETLRLIRYGAFALIALLALGWIAVGLGLVAVGGRAPIEGKFAIGSPVVASFKLTDHNGQAVSEADMLGRPAVVFFGFTYCPLVCPTTMASLSSTLGKMGPEADKLGVYFVSVDPERDTVAELKPYMAAFDPRIRGLTGAADQIAAVAKPLRVYYAKVKVEGGAGYTMDHDATVYLIDAKGSFAGSIAYGEDAATALAKLERLAKGG